MEYFSKNLRYLIKKTNINQTIVSAIAGRGQTTIANWVNGRNKPKYETLIAVCDYFGVEVTDFLVKDLENENFITDEYLSSFKARNPVETKRSKKYALPEHHTSMVNEEDRLFKWMVARELKTIQDKIDVIATTLKKE